MITLKNTSDQIMQEISREDIDTHIDERFIFLKIRQHLNEQLRLEVYNRRNQFDKSPITQYIATYPNLLVKDDGNYKYVDIPDFYLSMPYNKGIYQVCPNKDMHNPLIKRNFPSISSNLRAGKLQGRHGYWVEGMRIIFLKGINFKKATIKLIVAAPDQISPNEALPITPEIQAEVIRRIKNELLNTPPKDIISNEIDDRRAS